MISITEAAIQYDVMPFNVTANVHVERAPNGTVRQLRHLQEPYLVHTLSGRSLAAHYVQDVADCYALPRDALTTLESPFRPTNSFTGEPARLHFAGENAVLATRTIAFVQTVGDLPIWEAGLSVTIQAEPDRVTSSVSTFHHDADFERPERDFQTYSVAELERILQLDPRRQIEVTSQRRLIYRYETAQRTDPAGAGTPASMEDLNPPFPPIPETITDGSHYVVVEVLFTTDPERAALNWRVFIEERTGSVLYLRALVACVLSNVFHIDPVSDTGDGTLTGCSGHAMLDPVQTTVAVPLTSANPQSLTSEFVTLRDLRSPTAAPPTSPPANFTALASDSIDFGAVNSFHHMDRFFRLMSDLGIDPTTYFRATKLPLPVDHLDTTGPRPGPGLFGGWAYGNPNSKGCESIGLSYASKPPIPCTNPVLAGCDQRLVFHECSHLILWEKTHWGRLRFSHSTGDSLAIIFAAPHSKAPDPFVSFPFIPAVDRRHDRHVAAGWAWGGPKDKGESDYGSEQILATTQFRLYRSAGGDDDRKTVQTYASDYILHLIIKAVGLLPPAECTPTLSVDIWATALMCADIGTSSFRGVPGGTVHKMIRWTFEKQGLYQPPGAAPPPNVATAGAPPDVDVYIDDGRGGEYCYLQSFWNTTDIWNRNSPDGGTTHDPPIVGAANYAYVRVKNRGTQTANNVTVSGYHASPATALTWPHDWTAMTTASLAAGPIPSRGSIVVGPFVWTPQFVGHECMLMIASADGDLPNTDPSTYLPCATGPTPHWRLVPFDNNIGQRNVTPVIADGGLKA
jgi:zinc metalloprotease ZmpB